MHPVEGAHSALESMQVNAPGHLVPLPGPKPRKAVFLAVKSELHIVPVHPSAKCSVILRLRDQPCTTTQLLQPAQYCHVKGPVPGTLTGGASMNTAMDRSHERVQLSVALYPNHPGTPELHQAVHVPLVCIQDC